MISALEINADLSDVHVVEEDTKITVADKISKKIIKLPWSDCIETHKKFSFSKNQVEKENKIYEEYKKFASNHRNLTDFSMHFVAKEYENNKAEILFKLFFSVLETNKIVKSPNSPVINFKKQELLFNKELEDKINYKRKYDDNVFLPSSKNY
ncbi:MAG: DUF2532 domain-containing protein [Rickettsia endosymbiont of Argas persicus]